MLDASQLTADALARSAVVVAVELLLLGTSLLSICVIRTTDELYDVIGCYLVGLPFTSLDFASLASCSVFFTPFFPYERL